MDHAPEYRITAQLTRESLDRFPNALELVREEMLAEAEHKLGTYALVKEEQWYLNYKHERVREKDDWDRVEIIFTLRGLSSGKV